MRNAECGIWNIEFRTRSTANGSERDSAIMIDLSATVAVIPMRDILSRLFEIRSDVLQFPQRISQRLFSVWPSRRFRRSRAFGPQFREPRGGDCLMVSFA
jgi:hypothetical protein